MADIQIDEHALCAMESLLAEHFSDTLGFCCSELERLAQAIFATLDQDNVVALRHAHSLKSNAAQFGAVSLCDVARAIELHLNHGDVVAAKTACNDLMYQVEGSQLCLKQWLATRTAN